jgi:cation diffusion facilitator family transporter
MRERPDDGTGRARRVAVVGIAATSLLAALNIVVGSVTQSTSVLAAGIEFAGDVLASSIVLAGMIAAVKPADANHPYGHGRIETVAAFVVGVMLSIGGVGVCWNSLQAIGVTHPAPSRWAVAALVLTIAVRAVMSTAKFRIGRRIGSASLIADSWNDTVDILAAVTALTAVALTMYDPGRFLAADHYGGFAVGLIVILTGLRVLRDASLELIDTMPNDGMIERVRSAALEIPGVLAVDKSYARKTGFRYHVDLHIEVNPELTVAASHEIAGQVRSHVRDRIDWVADVLVHVEPSSASTPSS